MTPYSRLWINRAAPRSAKHDAEQVVETLEQAKRQAAPLRDPGLTKQIDDAAEHVRRRIDPKRGG